jgi:hypothetical protein
MLPSFASNVEELWLWDDLGHGGVDVCIASWLPPTTGVPLFRARSESERKDPKQIRFPDSELLTEFIPC